jgi:hypothetical protein
MRLCYHRLFIVLCRRIQGENLIFLFHCHVVITVSQIYHPLTYSSYYLPIWIYLITHIRLLIKRKMVIDPDNGSGSCGGFCFGTDGKRKEVENDCTTCPFVTE